MTAPIAVGFPDWGRTSARAKVIYHDITDLDIDAVEQLPVKYVGDHTYLQVFFSAVTNHFFVAIDFKDQELGGTTIGWQSFTIRQGDSFRHTFPIPGPFVSIAVTPSAVNSAYLLNAWSTSVPDQGNGPFDSGRVKIDLDGISIAAGATRTDSLDGPWPGWWSWGGESTAASWISKLEAIDDVGGITVLDRLSQGTGAARRLLHLPFSSLRIRTTNNDAGARSFFIYGTSHPYGRFG